MLLFYGGVYLYFHRDYFVLLHKKQKYRSLSQWVSESAVTEWAKNRGETAYETCQRSSTEASTLAKEQKDWSKMLTLFVVDFFGAKFAVVPSFFLFVFAVFHFFVLFIFSNPSRACLSLFVCGGVLLEFCVSNIIGRWSRRQEDRTRRKRVHNFTTWSG